MPKCPEFQFQSFNFKVSKLERTNTVHVSPATLSARSDLINTVASARGYEKSSDFFNRFNGFPRMPTVENGWGPMISDWITGLKPRCQ
jgi:hypothetical protein